MQICLHSVDGMRQLVKHIQVEFTFFNHDNGLGEIILQGLQFHLLTVSMRCECLAKETGHYLQSVTQEMYENNWNKWISLTFQY